MIDIYSKPLRHALSLCVEPINRNEYCSTNQQLFPKALRNKLILPRFKLGFRKWFYFESSDTSHDGKKPMSRPSVRVHSMAKWLENTFNGTLVGWKSMHQGTKYFFLNPELKAKRPHLPKFPQFWPIWLSYLAGGFYDLF